MLFKTTGKNFNFMLNFVPNFVPDFKLADNLKISSAVLLSTKHRSAKNGDELSFRVIIKKLKFSFSSAFHRGIFRTSACPIRLASGLLFDSPAMLSDNGL